MFKLTKLVKYLFLTGSAILLLFVLLNAVSLDLTKKGPNAVSAQDGSIVNYDSGLTNPSGEIVNYDSGLSPFTNTPPAQQPQQSQSQGQGQATQGSSIPGKPTQGGEITPKPASCTEQLLRSECDGTGPGRVAEVWQNSDCSLGYRNHQFQAGVCGDVPQPSVVCRDELKYSECTWQRNDEVREVFQNTCTGNYTVGRTLIQPGACPMSNPQPQPQPQPAPQPVIPASNPVAPICDPNQVQMSVNPNSTNVGGQITFNVSGSQGSTWLDDQFSGGVSNSGGFWGSRTLTANNPGTYTWTHYWRNTAPNRTDIVSDLCQKSVSYTINQPTPPPPPAQVLCPLTISTSSINVDQSATYTLSTQNAPANSTATWQGSNNGGTIPANPNFPVNFSNAYSGLQHGGPGFYTRYIQIVSNGQVVCTSNSVSLTVNQPVVPTPTPTPTPTPRPTVAPTPAPTTPPQVVANVKCPEGSTQTMENNIIICIQNVNNNNNVNNNQVANTFNPVINVPQPQTPQVVYAVAGQPTQYIATAAAEPKVAYVAPATVQALPKTGLPMAGVALGSLLPIGLRLRKVGKKDLGNSVANLLWQERQFKI